MKIDFKQLKKDISLPDFLIELGWKVVSGSSKSSPKFSNGNHTIIIKKNVNEEYTYWDVHSQNIRGRSIIDLMQLHIEETTGRLVTVREAAEAIIRYLQTHEIIQPKDSLYEVGNVELTSNEIISLIHELKPYSGNYLKDRGIIKEALSSLVFKETFYLRTIKNRCTEYYNVCVKMSDENGLKAISQRNDDFKGIIGSKFNSLAFSGYDSSRPIDILYIGESIIDCISHYQLKHLDSSKNILYASSEGTLTTGQINLIKKLIEIQKIPQMTTIFDNDLNGYRYTIWLYNSLNGLEIDKNINEEAIKNLAFQIPNTEFSNKKDWNDTLMNLIR